MPVHDAGAMHIECNFCGARTWASETIRCCSYGAVQLQAYPAVPPELSAAILTPHVRQHIRAYNMSMAMASVGHENRSLPDGDFVLGGRTYHRVGNLHPRADAPHSFAQIYVLDPEPATDRRIAVMGGSRATLRRDMLATLHSLLSLHNPWVRQFVQAASNNAQYLVWRSSDDLSTMGIGAMVAEPGSRRDITFRNQQDGNLNFIDDGHPLYHPLAYPLLFPMGSFGWCDNMQAANADYSDIRRVTLTEWGRYYLQHRSAVTHWQRCERLTLEFYCDVWAQVESRVAHFHRLPAQQAKYRGARVAALEDQLSAGIPAADIGAPVVRLPSSFVGSARFYQQLYLDAMALPKKFGKPDLFITVTCNPNWPEIRNALPANSHWTHHRDIVERVFMIKLRSLTKDIVKQEIFGSVLAYVYRVEWQARGLPHAHMLFILQDKILAARHIDDIFSAEIPDAAAEPEYQALVVKHMLHPRCDVDTTCGCRQDNNGNICDCSRHFPMQMTPTTVLIPDGYPRYRRRGQFTAVMRDGRFISDDWVVAHNKFLLLRYKCHINVEVCTHFRAFKYVYKYTFKMPDYTAIAVDEIDAHLSGRLLTASEAVHRLLELPLHKEWPPVVRLDVHLPKQQRMVFDPTDDETALLAQVTETKSTLLAWFDLNADDAYARTLLYHEVPSHYTWSNSQWHRRIRLKVRRQPLHDAVTCAQLMHVQTQAVGRLYGVSHHNSELFALRLLLGVVKGPTSFEDLATHDGVIHENFRNACYARGLISDDDALVIAMREIVETTVSIDHIRKHFARMLVHSAPTDPRGLFNLFVDDLSERNDGQADVDAALLAIEESMMAMNRSLTEADFGFVLPSCPTQQMPQRRGLHNSTIAVSESIRQRDELLPIFSDEQKDAMRDVIASIGNEQMCNVFAVLASAGCGKTVFANGLASYLRAQGRTVVCVAASALAAMLLLGGATAHSTFHIPIPANETSTCNLSYAEREALKRVDLIIYDECSMVHADVADTVERTLRDVMRNQRPFGGKTVVWMGDFKQLLPVVRYGKGQNHTIQQCSWWNQATKLSFTTNWRAVQNPVYTAFLETVGNGRVDSVVPPDACRCSSFDEIIENVYGDHFNSRNQILALTLDTCAEINRRCFAKLPGETSERPAADQYVDCSDRDAFPPDYVQSLAMHGAPPWMLQFKPGAKYMCIRNLDPERGIINGTMMKLLSVGRNLIQVQILTGKSAGSCDILTRCVFTITPEASGLPFTILRSQFPIIPAYCLSVHKAQGQTLDTVGVVFESDPFTHGQLYVALSRVGGWEKVYTCYQGDNILNVVLRHLLA